MGAELCTPPYLRGVQSYVRLPTSDGCRVMYASLPPQGAKLCTPPYLRGVQSYVRLPTSVGCRFMYASLPLCGTELCRLPTSVGCRVMSPPYLRGVQSYVRLPTSVGCKVMYASLPLTTPPPPKSIRLVSLGCIWILLSIKPSKAEGFDCLAAKHFVYSHNILCVYLL